MPVKGVGGGADTVMVRSFLLLACVALGVAAPPAAAWTVAANPGVSTGDQHIEYPAFSAPDRYPPQMKVTNVGDVNGDGREDIAATFDYAESGVTPIWVTFSSASASSGPVAEQPGFKIVARRATYGMAAAGDIDGDGLGDIAIARDRDVDVVFGRAAGGTIDLDELGDGGFTILRAGAMAGGSSSGWHANGGVAALGDLDGDAVGDLLVASVSGATIVYLPGDPAGETIDAGAPGARVARIHVDRAHALMSTRVDVLGDLDGDGRSDVLVASEEATGTDQVAYGVSSPAPGEAVRLPAAVQAGKAFAIRTRDGRDGSRGELEQAVTLGDQNGDGIRDVGLVCGSCGAGTRQLRVVFSPRLGSTIDAGDLYAADPRGWSFHTYGNVIDAGDQNGDGIGDVGTNAYVYFPDPRSEPGTREPVYSGFYFSTNEPAENNNYIDVQASLADLNGDGRREIAVSRMRRHYTNGVDWRDGEWATYALDVFDSATVPVVAQPDVPVARPNGELEVGVAVRSGSGSRGDRSLAVTPTLEIATPTGAPEVVARPGAMRGAPTVRLGVQPRWALGGLVSGQRYRVRATAANSRGQDAVGPWREFTYGSSSAGSAPVAGTLRLAVGTKTVRVRDGRVAVSVTCGPGGGRCRGKLSLKAGALRLGSRSFKIDEGRRSTVSVTLTKAARRALRSRRSVRVTATAKATNAAGLAASVTSRFTARLRG